MLKRKTKLDELYCQYAGELRVRFIGQLRSDQGVDDLVHEVFLRVQKTLERGDIDHPRTFLMRVADSVFIDSMRRLTTRRRLVDDDSSDQLMSGAPDPSPGPEQIEDSKQVMKLLCAAIETLPPRVRQALVLHKFEHLSYREVAKVMGISPRTVEQHLSRGLMECRSKLQAAGCFGYGGVVPFRSSGKEGT